MINPNRRLALLTILVTGLLVRLCLIGFFAARSDVSPGQIVSGHDGGEYVAFGRALAGGSLAGVPEDSRRHDPGWPMAIASVSRLPHAELLSFLLGYAALAGAIFIGVRLLRTTGNASDGQSLMWAAAMVGTYPAQLYYGCFVLSEPLFTLLLVAGVAAYVAFRQSNPESKSANRWYIAAYALAGLAGLVRAPGMLLAFAFLFESFCTNRNASRTDDPRPGAILAYTVARAWPILLTVGPWVLWTFAAKQAWGGQLIFHGPKFSWPFSGFAGWQEFGGARATYILICVGGVVVSTVALIVQWRRCCQAQDLKTTLLLICAAFCALFVVFHLCLRSLHYIDRDVLTFNYQDRYYVGLLPFLLLPWLRWLRWWIVGSAAMVSVMLSAYWGTNYFSALAAQ
ncbi:MAG: phospholipid carrier-dependent glycosyltransferase [Candidatus Sumerlaeaceae bacterium]